MVSLGVVGQRVWLVPLVLLCVTRESGARLHSASSGADNRSLRYQTFAQKVRQCLNSTSAFADALCRSFKQEFGPRVLRWQF